MGDLAGGPYLFFGEPGVIPFVPRRLGEVVFLDGGRAAGFLRVRDGYPTGGGGGPSASGARRWVVGFVEEKTAEEVLCFVPGGHGCVVLRCYICGSALVCHGGTVFLCLCGEGFLVGVGGDPATVAPRPASGADSGARLRPLPCAWAVTPTSTSAGRSTVRQGGLQHAEAEAEAEASKMAREAEADVDTVGHPRRQRARAGERGAVKPMRWPLTSRHRRKMPRPRALSPCSLQKATAPIKGLLQSLATTTSLPLCTARCSPCPRQSRNVLPARRICKRMVSASRTGLR